MRLIRKDLLNERLDKDAKSYWNKKDNGVFAKEQYERQFQAQNTNFNAEIIWRDLSEQDIYIQGVMGFHEGTQEILACTYYYHSFVIRSVNNIY